MKNKNTQSGITLIALVVTIVVLLILAGITVGFVLSDGGIFQSAKDAKDAQKAGEISDLASQIYPAMIAKYYDPENEDDTQVVFNQTDLQKFFPGMTVSEGATLTGTKDAVKGVNIATGEFTVDGFTVKFTNSAPKVTPPAAE